MSIVFNPTPRQAAALQAVCALHNANNRVNLTPDEFVQQELVAKQLDGYAQTLRVGLIPPYEFVERFQRLGRYDSIFELAKSDRNVAGYLAILREKRDDVNLFSETVGQGLGYLMALGQLTTDEVAWLLSLQVPAPAETMPQRSPVGASPQE